MLRSDFLLHLLLLLCGIDSFVIAFEISGINATIKTCDRHPKLGSKCMIKEKVTKLSVTCRLNDSKALKSPKIRWRRFNDPVNSNVTTGPKMQVSSTTSDEGRVFESVLTVEKTVENVNLTAYKCTGTSDNTNKEINVAFHSIPLLYITVNSSDNTYSNSWMLTKQPDLMTENNIALNITCHTSGYPPSTPRWTQVDTYGNQLDCKKCSGDKLNFNNTDYKDRSHYVCSAENAFGNNELKIYLRVKNPNAYLLPTILLSIITPLLLAIYIVTELVFNKKRELNATNNYENSDESIDETV